MSDFIKNAAESFVMVAVVLGSIVGALALTVLLPVWLGWWGVAIDVFVLGFLPFWISAYRHVRENGRDMIK